MGRLIDDTELMEELKKIYMQKGRGSYSKELSLIDVSRVVSKLRGYYSTDPIVERVVETDPCYIRGDDIDIKEILEWDCE